MATVGDIDETGKKVATRSGEGKGVGGGLKLGDRGNHGSGHRGGMRGGSGN